MPEIDKQTDPASEADISRRFVEFIIIHTQNILFVLGRIPTPDGRVHEPNLDVARELIDQLEAIQHKTRGNISPEEARILESSLSTVRLAFVETFQDGSPEPSRLRQTPTRPAESAPPLDSAVPPASADSESKDKEKDREDGKRFVKKYG